jgi:aspartate aminotransferase
MIPAELEVLLEPLERFEGIRRKATRLGGRLADLSYANPYEGVHESVRSVLKETLEEERLLDLQYSPFGGQTLIRRAVADALRASHGLDFEWSDLVLTPGAMGALHLALRAAGKWGSEVIVPVPCWLDYPLYALHAGLTPVTVRLDPPRFELDAAAVEASVSHKTCAVLLSHPANPTGRNYTHSELSELAATIKDAESRHGCSVTVIADETHRDFVPLGSYASAAGSFERTLIVYSFGKYHFMQGQRIGYAAVSPKHPERTKVGAEMARWTRITGLCTPTSVMQRSLPRLLKLRHDMDWLAHSREHVTTELLAAGHGVVESDATLFVYVRNPTERDDFEFVEELVSRGVLVLPAPVFHHDGYFRLSLTGSRQMLERALEVLSEVPSEVPG